MDEMNMNANPASEQENGEKTFTQSEVDTIVRDRLAKEKAKYEKRLAEMQAEVSRREMRLTAQERLNEKNLPTELIDLIKLDSEDAMNSSLALLERTYTNNKTVSVSGAKPAGVAPASSVSPITSENTDAMIRKTMGL